MAEITNLAGKALPGIKNNQKIWIAEANSRFEKNWKNKEIRWAEFLARLKNGTRTQETQAEYFKLPKIEQDNIKDVGGFVGGTLKNGTRKSNMVDSRSMITLDLDFAPVDFAADMELADYAWAVYSTHKHTKEKPRLRLIIPLKRQVTAEEYEAIARKMAEEIGMKYMDATAFRPSQLMYWGSCSRDAEYIFEYCDEPFLDPDVVLKTYPDWKDTSYWPLHPDELRVDKKRKEKQADPRKKPGLIGAFCRIYTIQDAIAEFLPDVYAPCEGKSDRYSYLSGTTSGGLVIYDDGLFAYSNHSTDPARGLDLNAFDLVRIHKFGEKDDKCSEETPVTKLPSYKAMMELVTTLPSVKLEIVNSKRQSAEEDFAGEDEEEPDKNWKSKLDIGKNGVIKSTIENVTLILQNDPQIQGIAYNEVADNIEIRQKLPWDTWSKYWTDYDDSRMLCYLAFNYGEFAKATYYTAFDNVVANRRFNPIKEMLESLPEWDHIERVDTLLVDYLGADDNVFTREAIRKMLCAAYVRIYNPGAKFDYMLVLNGDQGIGKSTLISKLGGEWYSDSLNVSDMNDKTAAEKLQGYWIMEVGELAGLRKADIDKVKAFISRQDDKYRASFARRVTSHPRRCVIFGTTNSESGYLRDITGNRRYWNVRVQGDGLLSPWDMTHEEVAQIWAEVKHRVKEGEELCLSTEAEKLARTEQINAMESDERQGLVEEYLEILLPSDWVNKSPVERYEYIKSKDFHVADGTRRDRVSNIEIWVECFGKNKEDMRPQDSYAITSIMTRLSGWKKEKNPVFIKGYGRQRVYKRL